MKVTQIGTTFRFDTDIDAIKPNLTDELFAAVTALYGQRVNGVKLSGYWLIYVGGPGHRTIVSGSTLAGQRRHRKLSAALAEGLGITIHTV